MHAGLFYKRVDAMKNTLDRFWSRLEERPYRFTVLNISMLTLLLTMMGSKTLFIAIGGLSLIIAGLYCVIHAALLTWNNWKDVHPYQMALIWAPGGIALLLSGAGIYLATQHDVGTALYIAGCIMFGFEVAVLAVLGAELRDSELSIKKYLEVK